MTAMRSWFCDGEGRRMRYFGVLGWTCSFREGSEERKSEEVNGMGDSGVRLSPVIVMGKAKREESAVKELKASCSSEEAV